MKILMVCLGNICRSPLAQGLLEKKIKENNLDWQVDSAGTNGYHTGEHPHKLSQKIAAQKGVDISQQKSRKLTKADFEQFDVIYAMANDVINDMKAIAENAYKPEKVKLILNEWKPDSDADVPDPWYGGEDGYTYVYNLIDKATDSMIKNYTNGKN